ncbi:hypothetical protein [Paraburkholderia diazotrophica]
MKRWRRAATQAPVTFMPRADSWRRHHVAIMRTATGGLLRIALS